jgi:uncharacterized protein YktB (UPF0637 family)
MVIEPFAPKDFRVFDLPAFADRMAAIRAQVRPKLEGLGAALAPDVAKLTGTEIHAHVAKHARRTVNPPADTWVAFGPDRQTARWSGPDYARAARETFGALRDCFRLE